MFKSTFKFFSIRSLNRVTLVGAMHDLQSGFLGQSSVFQFTLTCSLLDTNKNSEDDKKDASSKSTLGGTPLTTNSTNTKGVGVSNLLKEQYTIRCFGSEAYTDTLKNILDDGSIVQVIGRLKTVESMEAGKKQLFPFIFVEQGRWSSITLLHSARKQRCDWQLQEALAETPTLE